jgi:hypothetical protein
MKTATPPKGVTARWVSRRITRSPESRAVISRGTSLSEMFASTPLYRKHLRAKYSSASEFRIKEAVRRKIHAAFGVSSRNPADRSRRNDRLERIVREAVAFRGLVEMKFWHCVHHMQGAVSLPSLNKRARSAAKSTGSAARARRARTGVGRGAPGTPGRARAPSEGLVEG